MGKVTPHLYQGYCNFPFCYHVNRAKATIVKNLMPLPKQKSWRPSISIKIDNLEELKKSVLQNLMVILTLKGLPHEQRTANKKLQAFSGFWQANRVVIGLMLKEVTDVNLPMVDYDAIDAVHKKKGWIFCRKFKLKPAQNMLNRCSTVCSYFS